MKKNFLWNTIGTTLNAFNSLFFMIIVTRINGMFDAGIFTFAFSNATVLNIIGEYSGRIYQVTDNSRITDKDFIVNKIFTCSVMIFIAIMFIIFNKYNLYKSTIIFLLCFLKMLEAFANVIYSIFQKEENLYKVGISLTLKSIISLLVFIILDITTKNVIVSILGIIFTYIVIMILYDGYNFKKSNYKNEKTNYKNVFLILKGGFFTFAMSFLTMYIINAPKYAIDKVLSEEFQTVFGIIVMPATVMILFTQFIIHPFLTMIKKYIIDGNYVKLRNVILKIIAIIAMTGIMVIIISYLIGIPILNLVYNLNLNEYKSSLMVIIIGSVCYGITSVLTTLLIASRHTLSETINYLGIAIITYMTTNILVRKYAVNGAAISYLIIMILTLISFSILTVILINKDSKNFKISDNNK